MLEIMSSRSALRGALRLPPRQRELRWDDIWMNVDGGFDKSGMNGEGRDGFCRCRLDESDRVVERMWLRGRGC